MQLNQNGKTGKQGLADLTIEEVRTGEAAFQRIAIAERLDILYGQILLSGKWRQAD